MLLSRINSGRPFFASKLRAGACIFYLMIMTSIAVAASTDAKSDDALTGTTEPAGSARAFAAYDWNLDQSERPLLNLPDQVNEGVAVSLAYPMGQFRFPLFQPLHFNPSSGGYSLQLIAAGSPRTIELKETETQGNYASSDGSRVYLVDNKDLKKIRMNDATEYTFVRFTDGSFRCIRVKTRGGAIITLVYTRDNRIHCLVDSFGRTLKFNYQDQRIGSITQTWIANSVALTKDWPLGSGRTEVKFAHASNSQPLVPGSAKPVPNNAITTRYTRAMIDSDRLLAGIFGGAGAVAAANGFEPEGLAGQYPLYRGDVTANDGRILRGHLSYAMHLYGNAHGTADMALYVPAGFTSHSPEPSPTDAAVTFFYPRLGNLTNVTLAVFHVANFSISNEGGRVRIGNIGGPGGSVSSYKHSHIEFYRGDTGLPSAAARTQLRIDPVSVFRSRS